MSAGRHTGTGLDRWLAAGLALPPTSRAYSVSWFVETLLQTSRRSHNSRRQPELPEHHTARCAACAMVAALLAVDLLNLDGSVALALVLGSGAFGALVMG